MPKSKKAQDDFSDVFNTETPADVKKRNEEVMQNAGKGLPYFSLQEDDTAVVRFLDDRPLSFYQHRVFDATLKQGQGSYRNLTCIRKNCPMCQVGNRPRFVGAYRIIHIDAVDKNGKVAPQLKVFLKGVNCTVVLEKKNQRNKLSSENMEVERIGQGFDTQYLFEWTGQKNKPKKYNQPDEPVSLQDMFKPQHETLERLAQTLKKKSSDGADDDYGDKDDEEEEVQTESKSKKGKGKKKEGKRSNNDKIPF
jgi:hypothetical protein